MNPNDIPLGSTMLDRVMRVSGDNTKWKRYIQDPFVAIPQALIPLIRDKLEMDRVADEAKRYNKNRPSSEWLDTRPNDTYFHQHAMYEAAQHGIYSAMIAALAGEIKEKYWDKPKKIANGDSPEKIDEDSKKDLKNNYLAIKMALESDKPVDEVIKPNPTVQRIWEMRNAKK